MSSGLTIEKVDVHDTEKGSLEPDFSVSAVKHDGYGHAVDGIVNSAPSFRIPGNLSPLGLFSFASTNFILSIVNIYAKSVFVPNAVVGVAIFFGGSAQLLSGTWEFATGNVYGATLFVSYGLFWSAYASILIPQTGIWAVYSATPQEPNAIGIFLATWFIITFIFLLSSLRANIIVIATLGFLDVAYASLMIAQFTGSIAVTKAGGWFGLVTAALAYYLGAAQLISTENSYFGLPVGIINKKRTD
jgi:hypothetical protein